MRTHIEIESAQAPPDLREKVQRIIDDEGVAGFLPPCAEVRARVERQPGAGVDLAQAHGVWQAAYLDLLPPLRSFPSQPRGMRTPPNLVQVTIECVEGPGGGMSSYFGFRGTFVSLLVSIDSKCVWDSRVERAT